MDRFEEIIKKLEDLGENRYYNDEELKKLEEFFGKKIDFAYPGWVAFIDKKDGHEYKGFFSTKAEDFMISLCENRIQGLRELADRIDACSTDEEVMGICAKIMIDYAMSWKKVEPRMDDTARAKRTLLSIKSVEVKQGKLVYEGKDKCYSAIVLDPYYGSVVIRRTENGKYFFSGRVPLCGERQGVYDSLHLKGRLVRFMDFIAY